VPIQVTCPSCNATLKTADSSAGKRAKCPKCGGIIQIPEMAAPEDEEYALEAEPTPLGGFSDDELSSGPPTGDDRKPCPACGEMIMRNAVKCRFCGEIFDPILKKKEQKKRVATDEDSDLTVGEWIVAILCSGIGCIIGIIWMIQGKPKGKKMLLVSLAVQGFWVLVRVALEASRM
jgi:predicted RNA-binding Zn-ribbon protein involved in translation (DUF1610 family)